MIVIIVMVAACILLVGISYFMLDILARMIVTPKTPVSEVAGEGELFIPLEGVEVLSMQASADGRFLAYIERPEGGDSGAVRVVELDDDGRVACEQETSGTKLAWLGDTALLVFEDAGDIHLLDAESGERENLTASPENDSDPIPSPDGRYILWRVSPAAASGDTAGLWLMGPGGEDKEYLAEAQDLAVWGLSGDRIFSRRGTAITSGGESYRYFLQAAVPGRPGWEYYADCEGEVYFIWCPQGGDVLYVGPMLVKEQDRIKGVWSRVEQPDKIKRMVSSDGLGNEISYYSFYASRRDDRLAYVGEKGLECLDYEERVIYRYTDLKARVPLAWNEAANEIFFIGPGGIRRIAAEGE